MRRLVLDRRCRIPTGEKDHPSDSTALLMGYSCQILTSLAVRPMLCVPIQRRLCGSVILAGMPYNDERDILIRRDETDWASPISPASGRAEELWPVMSPVAVRNPLH